MRFVEFLLLERLAALVHTNDSQTLKVISNLVKAEFGVENPNGVGACLYSQFLFTVESVTGVPINTLQKFYSIENRFVDGHTPAEMMKYFNSGTFEHNGEMHQLKVHLEEYDANEAIEQVKQGQPVVVIIRGGGEFYRQAGYVIKHDGEKINGDRHPGEVTKTPSPLIDPNVKPNRNSYHALLMIGYDLGHKLVIMRDSRSSYAYKGYLRAKADLLKAKESFKFFGFVVDSFDKVK